MKTFDFDTVVKIGSMALVRKEDNDLDYNIISRLAHDLRPGCILISSGATEIGRLDFIKRNGAELRGDLEDIKADYSAQGQTILMSLYRQFIESRYSVRQVLVEHAHFNDEEKADHLRRLFFRAASQNAIPIVNYNDTVSSEENRKMEISSFIEHNGHAVECVDNDETAAVTAKLVRAERLIMLTSVEGIYRDASDPSTLIEEVRGSSYDELSAKLDSMMSFCHGASRRGAEGASAKLRYARIALEYGATVTIAHARHRLSDIVAGNVPCTTFAIDD